MKGNVNDPKRISPYDLQGIAKLSGSPISLTSSLLASRRPPELLDIFKAENVRLRQFIARLIKEGDAISSQLNEVFGHDGIWEALADEWREENEQK